MKRHFVNLLSGCILAVGFCFSCSEAPRAESYPVLSVSLKAQQVSVFDFFTDVKLIPLQTSEESFLRYPSEIAVVNDTIYVFDKTLYSLFIFAPDGSYINKIQRVGRGPNEYIMAYHFTLDENKRVIHLLNPQGSVHSYAFDGTFINSIQLPLLPYNYQYIEMIAEDRFVTWSSTLEDEVNVVNIVDINSGAIENGYFFNSAMWGKFKPYSLFHKFNGEVFYHESLDDKVYRLTTEGYEVAYRWDIGMKQIIDPKRLVVKPEKANNAGNEILEDFKTGKIPLFFARQLQSARYNYASLVIPEAEFHSIFYDKTLKKSTFFGNTREGFPLILNMMNDDYAIGHLYDYDALDDLKKVLSPEDINLLNNRQQNDNPLIVKYIF